VRAPTKFTRRRLSKHVPVAENSHATIEELLEGRGVFNAVRVLVKGEYPSQLDDSQSRETVKYGHETHGIGRQERLARSNNDLPDPTD
jgi:hypothetical protein